MTEVRIGAFEAKSKLGKFLDQVEAGTDVVITRRGRAVARLTSPGSDADLERARAAAARIKHRRKQAALGGLTIMDLVFRSRP